MRTIPTATMPKKMARSFGFTTLDSMTREGRDKAVTPIMKASAVPKPTPLAMRASAMGSVPKISAYMGIPMMVATRTDHHLSAPQIEVMKASGM